jgi:hypothetical protein
MSDQQSQQDNQPEPQQHDGQVVVPPQVDDLIINALQLLCNVLVDYLSKADWVHELLIGEHPQRILNETEGDMKEGVNSIPPNLEEFIPGERLPDIIEVYVTNEFLFRASGCLDYLDRSTPQPERPIKFVRLYPGRTVIDKGMFNTPS